MTTTITGTEGVSQCAANSVSQDDLQTSVVGKGPAFHATAAFDQPATSGVAIKCICGSEQFDTANCFDTTLSRFTPNVPGYYRISARALGVVAASQTSCDVQLWKNGALLERNAISLSSGVLNAAIIQITDLFFFNGTTDYMELFVAISGSAPLYVGAGCTFSGELVRAA